MKRQLLSYKSEPKAGKRRNNNQKQGQAIKYKEITKRQEQSKIRENQRIEMRNEKRANRRITESVVKKSTGYY